MLKLIIWNDFMLWQVWKIFRSFQHKVVLHQRLPVNHHITGFFLFNHLPPCSSCFICSISFTLAYINNMRDIVFSPNGVLKQLASLNPSKSAGLDGISPRCLRDLSAEVFKHFDIHFPTRLWHRHLNKRLVLTAMVVPVHKKLSKENPANYRRISLTCLCSKVMEHIVLSNLNKHLSENNIFVSSAIWLPGQHLKSALRSWCPSAGFLEGFRQSLPY